MLDKIKKSKFYGIKTLYLLKCISATILGICFFILFGLVHWDLDQQFYINFSQFSLDFAIILIPLILWITKFRSNYKKDKNDMYDLKQKLIMIRHEIARKEITKRFIDSALIIDNIISLLRKFNMKKEADILGYIINDKLCQLDNLIEDVIKKSKKIDYGKEYNRIKEELRFNIDILKKIDYKTADHDELKERFEKNIGDVLAYDLFLESRFKTESQTALYYYKDTPNN